MLAIERSIRSRGGIAKTEELLRDGHSPEIVRILARYGRIVRVRKGWYAQPSVPAAAIAAHRVGGRLACISAALHHGLVLPEGALAGRLELHVLVPRNASRLTVAPSRRRAMVGGELREVVLHWSRRELDGDRLAVSLTCALEQIERCQSREVAAVILRTAAQGEAAQGAAGGEG